MAAGTLAAMAVSAGGRAEGNGNMSISYNPDQKLLFLEKSE